MVSLDRVTMPMEFGFPSIEFRKLNKLNSLTLGVTFKRPSLSTLPLLAMVLPQKVGETVLFAPAMPAPPATEFPEAMVLGQVKYSNRTLC